MSSLFFILVLLLQSSPWPFEHETVTILIHENTYDYLVMYASEGSVYEVGDSVLRHTVSSDNSSEDIRIVYKEWKEYSDSLVFIAKGIFSSELSYVADDTVNVRAVWLYNGEQFIQDKLEKENKRTGITFIYK